MCVKKGKMILWLLAILLLLTALTGIPYVKGGWLSKPVYFKNYLEVPGVVVHDPETDEYRQAYQFHIQFVTMKNEVRSIEEIKFYEDINMEIETSEIGSSDFGLYTVKTQVVTVYRESESKYPISLTHARITYEGSLVQDAMVGQILLTRMEKPGLLQAGKTVTTTEGQSLFYFTAEEDILLERVDVAMLDRNREFAAAYVNGVSAQEVRWLKFEKGDEICVDYSFDSTGRSGLYDRYRAMPVLYYWDAEETRAYREVMSTGDSVSYTDFTFTGLFQYLRGRETAF